MAIPNTWGAPYGGYGGPPPAPPVIPARDLRPRRLWYVVAALLGVVLVGTGVTLVVLVIKNTVESVDTAHRFAAGGQRTFSFTQGKTRAIYVFQPERGHVDCRVPSALADSLTKPAGTFRVTRGARSWDRVLELTPRTGGDYPVTCASEVPGAEFALGDKPEVGGMVGGILAAIGCFLTAALAVPAICIVTAVRRGRHRRRLLAAAAPPMWGPSPSGTAPWPPAGAAV
ncbi:serine/arginine repetitive matrix protein 2 [Streptomyces misionensis]|uniref:Serine/arginine repetitive matrix protein 2 n=1 Tax=Streptomyces misionensis TaxID=67331 RepID=A0A5C6K3V7_9ACTN|nr:serine/arginine repetitive matrix protein 2 [Streptomyces misionensis]TWV57101.1 serine/arginine repetitive matrix protein 2 [Streptomyces misionensis]